MALRIFTLDMKLLKSSHTFQMLMSFVYLLKCLQFNAKYIKRITLYYPFGETAHAYKYREHNINPRWGPNGYYTKWGALTTQFTFYTYILSLSNYTFDLHT